MLLRSFLLIFTALFLQIGSTQAQSAQLAIQYYQNGEYEKAATIFSELTEKYNGNSYYLGKYVECLVELGEYETARDKIESAIKKNKDAQLYVQLGKIHSRMGEDEKAEEAYDKAIESMPAQRTKIIQLGQEFSQNRQVEEAIKTFQKGGELLENNKVFAYYLGRLYQQEGNISKMIESYLLSLEENPERLHQIKTQFQLKLKEKEDFTELQNQVFQAIQSGKNEDFYADLLTWAFIQSKNYRGALRQVTALDKRNDENGRRVYNLAQTAENDDALDIAIDAYSYILNEKGSSSPYFFAAQQQVMNCRLQQLTEGYQYSNEEIEELYQQYETFLDSMGRTGRTASIMADQAKIAAIYLNDMEKAISILEDLVNAPGINDLIKARAKIKLGDYYLIQGKKWDATLLYAQVDKAFPEAEIGEDARFKNAMLSYYTGDFEWAQEQFDILKAATSRMISNDAIDRSVFIMDNLNLDTTAHALTLYADAELLVFQNKFDPAFDKMDSLQSLYPEHGLQDDILYLKARIATKRNNFEQAREFYAKIVNDYPEEIRADNALYKWAELEQNHFENIDEAQRLYEKLFLEYDNSTLAKESRKRYRQLRGDNIQ